MKYGVDMLFPPTPSQAQAIASLGWEFCNVYIGGPRAASKAAWQEINGIRYPVRSLSSIFRSFVPTYVGRNVGDDPNNPWDNISRFTFNQGVDDADDANVLTGACGFDSPTLLVLDSEYGTWQAHPEETFGYYTGWSTRVAEAGHIPGLYTDPETVRELGNDSPFTTHWVAQWLRSIRGMQKAPVGRFDPRVPPPWDIWQFGSSLIAGVSVDLNSCADDITLATYG